MNDQHDIKREFIDDGSVSDVEKEDLGSEISDPFDPNDIDIVTKGFTVGQVLDRITHGEIVLDPDFQRAAGIWKLREKSRLIESLLLRIPLPMFYVSTDKNENWTVVDGLQRMTTIRDFADNSFALNDLEFLRHFQDYKFEDLPRPMQRRIRESELTLHMIQPSTPRGVTFTIFRRINTGGLPLSSQEIRHALYQGPATVLLRDLVTQPGYLDATTRSVSDDRMAGRECALRFLAFYMTPPEYYSKKDLDGFLSTAMEAINQMPKDEIDRLQDAFIDAMARSNALFGGRAFRKQYRATDSYRYPINKALFETWSVCLGRLNDDDFSTLEAYAEDVLHLFCEMMRGEWAPPNLAHLNLSFENAVSQDTSDPPKVKYRFAAVEGLIREILERAEMF
ncbi:MAG: DUF262 domain-containing protein [Rhodospirillaceae bacterium]|nr:DUF262 domain-containing protein [Rhodospirillales bacterium]